MVYTRSKAASFALFSLFLPLSVSAVPQNTTIDDSDQIRINYWTDADWSHDPLQGYEQFFVNGTRSFTYVPGAAAFFNFTGTGIYLQGPFANDQAQRSVTLDGQDMGTFSAYAPERLPSRGTSSVFWGKGGLENTLHIVAVMHVDTADKILVMDAWIFEADSTQSQNTDTNTAGAVASSPSSPSTTERITGNNGSPTMAAEGIIIGIGVPLALLLICSTAYCRFSRHLKREKQRQRNATKENMFPFSDKMTQLSQADNLTPAPPGPAPSHQRPVTSAPECSLGEPSSEPATAAVTGPRDGGSALSSHPLHWHQQAAADGNGSEGTLGLSHHPLFSPIPLKATASSDSHHPTPLPFAGAPMLFFEQHPDPIPPINLDYAPQPIVSTPIIPSLLHRFSAAIAGVILGLLDRTASRNSNVERGRDRRAVSLTDFRYNTTTSPGVNKNLGPDVEHAAPPR